MEWQDTLDADTRVNGYDIDQRTCDSVIVYLRDGRIVLWDLLLYASLDEAMQHIHNFYDGIYAARFVGEVTR